MNGLENKSKSPVVVQVSVSQMLADEYLLLAAWSD